MAPTWWSADTIAVVTESCTAAGLKIIKQLASAGFTPILTSNDRFKLLQAADLMSEQKLHIIPKLLDITDPTSVQQFAAWLVKEFGGLHILIHNAAVSESTSNAEMSKEILETDYYGTKQFIKAMIPLFRPLKQGSRIVVIGSASSPLDRLQGKVPFKWVDRLCEISNLSEEVIDSFIENYGEDLEQGKEIENGWPAMPEDADDSELFRDYAVSKVALVAYATLLGRDLSNWSLEMEKKIYVKFLCPGYTASCMPRDVDPQEFVAYRALDLALE